MTPQSPTKQQCFIAMEKLQSWRCCHYFVPMHVFFRCFLGFWRSWSHPKKGHPMGRTCWHPSFLRTKSPRRKYNHNQPKCRRSLLGKTAKRKKYLKIWITKKTYISDLWNKKDNAVFFNIYANNMTLCMYTDTTQYTIAYTSPPLDFWSSILNKSVELQKLLQLGSCSIHWHHRPRHQWPSSLHQKTCLMPGDFARS